MEQELRSLRNQTLLGQRWHAKPTPPTPPQTDWQRARDLWVAKDVYSVQKFLIGLALLGGLVVVSLVFLTIAYSAQSHSMVPWDSVAEIVRILLTGGVFP